MIICRNCKHENLEGTLFCGECGMQVIGLDPIVTHNIPLEQQEQTGLKTTQLLSIPEDLNVWAALHILDSGHFVPLLDRDEITLGRVSEAQPILPDIDLTPYKAYSNGVSRLHAALKRNGKQVVLSDLGTSNGTYVNGKRLEPNTDQPLQHGDTIVLGNLKLQIFFNNH